VSFALLLHSITIISNSRYLDGELIYRIKAENLVLKHGIESGTIPDEPMCVRSRVFFVRVCFVRSCVLFDRVFCSFACSARSRRARRSARAAD
jgi:hypothetical protein